MYYIIFRNGKEEKNIIFQLILMWNILSSVVDKWAVISPVLPKRQRGKHWFNLLVLHYYFVFFHFSYCLLFWIFLQSRTDFFLHYSCVGSSPEIFQRSQVSSTFPLSPLATSTLSLTVLFFPSSCFPTMTHFSPNSSQKSCPFSPFLGEGGEEGLGAAAQGVLQHSVSVCSPPFCSSLLL